MEGKIKSIPGFGSAKNDGFGLAAELALIYSLPMGTQAHKKSAPASVAVGILTVSTTRSLAEDESGNWMHRALQARGHRVVAHRLVSDDIDAITAALESILAETDSGVLLINGGTGISIDDVTIEAVRPLFRKELAGFATLFVQMSYQQIGSAALLSRAAAGVIGNTAVFCMPGSLKACRLACEDLIFPELGHLVHHLGIRR
jgi:molybdenum cofactor biosynthesis protein B